METRGVPAHEAEILRQRIVPLIAKSYRKMRNKLIEYTVTTKLNGIIEGRSVEGKAIYRKLPTPSVSLSGFSFASSRLLASLRDKYKQTRLALLVANFQVVKRMKRGFAPLRGTTCNVGRGYKIRGQETQADACMHEAKKLPVILIDYPLNQSFSIVEQDCGLKMRRRYY